jgi:2-methylcitrate dehydratase PrpD
VLAPSDGWKLPETSMKPYPSCRHTHPAIDAALALRTRIGRAPISAVEIESYPAALDLTDQSEPTSTSAAKFSIQFCVATTLTHGPPGLPAFEEGLDDRSVRQLVGRTTVRSAGDLAASYPERWGARITVRTGDGEHQAVQMMAKGDPEDPLTEAELARKVEGLLRYGGIGEEAIASTWEDPIGWTHGRIDA